MTVDDVPVIAVTMGDPAGIGPEVIVKALDELRGTTDMVPVVVGSADRLEQAARLCRVPSRFTSWDPQAEPSTPRGSGQTPVVDPGEPVADLAFGRLSPEAGRAAYRYIEAAVDLVGAGAVDGLCTAPLNKEALHAAGYAYPGHTELLAELSGSHDVSMMLVADRLRVVHVTTHMGLLDAIEKISPDLVLDTVERTVQALRALGVPRPHIAVCGINPHAGEGGLFGRGEEEQKIAPAIRAAQARGYEVSGPVPADTAFPRARDGSFDAVVAMYHDQGHCAVKVLGIDAGVNVTIGLPFVRTSVDHGTAFDIAGTGTADHRSMVVAMQEAVNMVRAGYPGTDRTPRDDS